MQKVIGVSNSCWKAGNFKCISEWKLNKKYLKIKPTASLETFLVATSDRCVSCNLWDFPTFIGGENNSCWKLSDLKLTWGNCAKVIYPKYYKHWPYTVAHTIDCVCSKMLNHGFNHGLFLLLFKLIPCPIHWIVYVLAYSNFIFDS